MRAVPEPFLILGAEVTLVGMTCDDCLELADFCRCHSRRWWRRRG